MLTKNILEYIDIDRENKFDTTLAVRAALADLRKSGGGRLLFPKDIYHFRPDRAGESYLFISNNDEGLKRIEFDLSGFEDIEIDGGDSTFIFHGEMTPFAVRDSRRVRLSNFTIDWERTFHSEVEVLAAHAARVKDQATVDVRIGAAYPYVVESERLLFLDETGRRCEMHNALEFDPERRETAYRVHDSYGLGASHQARELAPGIVSLTGLFGTIPTPGNILAIVHCGRVSPGIFLADSGDVGITDVTIHHAGAMGVIAQRTRDIRLERLRVTPAPNTGRLVSITADATHFVNCAGQIEMVDCLFEGQMDDATNVHGIYARISRLVGPRQIEIELVHGQQVGVDITQTGDTVEFVHQHDLLTYYHSAVASVDRINSKFTIVSFGDDLPASVVVGDAIASTGWIADVTIRGCTTRSNRARGFLLSTPGRVIIEDNHFHNPGAAILIAGDANYWFESGAVRDVTIRNNYFDNCLYGVWGRAVIDVLPEIEPENRPGAPYHRSITIEDNTFNAFDMRLVKAHCVDGLTVANNVVKPSADYPAAAPVDEPFSITDCRHVVVEHNTFTSSAQPTGDGKVPIAAPR